MNQTKKTIIVNTKMSNKNYFLDNMSDKNISDKIDREEQEGQWSQQK